MSEIKVNKISPRAACGTVTLGDSGDTFTIPAGATITNAGTANGFGATGAVNWQTTVKTSGFTATAGEGYFVDTSSGAVSVNLPAGTAGAVVGFKDYLNSFDTHALTLVQNGSDKIGGSTVNATISTEGIGVTLVFIDSTRGWLVTDDGLQSTASTAQYIAATGGTITTVCTNFKVHTFTGPGTFCVSNAGNAEGSNTVDYLVVAGAGGGGMGGNAASLPNPGCQKDGGGGGGAGGYRESPGAASGCYSVSPLGASPAAALPVAASPYPVTVGGGGAGAPDNPAGGTSGSNSIFAGSSTITSAGGGGGASKNQPGPLEGFAGGSGGGASHRNSPTANSTTGGGAGNTPPVNPPQGNVGGNANNPWINARGGGGGGALAPGQPGCNSGDGGGGQTTSITGSPVGYAGGGGGAGGPSNGPPSPGPMGNGGEGGVMSSGTCRVANTFGAGDGAGGTETKTAGTDNRGSGGGAGNPASSGGANGGSGIVVIRYKFQN